MSEDAPLSPLLNRIHNELAEAEKMRKDLCFPPEPDPDDEFEVLKIPESDLPVRLGVSVPDPDENFPSLEPAVWKPADIRISDSPGDVVNLITSIAAALGILESAITSFSELEGTARLLSELARQLSYSELGFAAKRIRQASRRIEKAFDIQVDLDLAVAGAISRASSCSIWEDVDEIRTRLKMLRGQKEKP